MDGPWMLDELAHAGTEHLDPGFVEGYDRKQGSPEATEDLEVFAGFGLRGDALVIDLGAGTGQFALPAAGRFGEVIAVDVSPVMLRVLQDRAAEAGLTNVRCVNAGLLGYQHEGPVADGVYTRNALHHLPDFWKGLAVGRMARMLRPGGVVRIHDLIYDFLPDEAEEVFDRWLENAVQDAASGYTSRDLAEHIRTEYSTYRWLFEPMLEAAGLRIESAQFRGRVYGAYTCTKP